MVKPVGAAEPFGDDLDRCSGADEQ